MTVPAHLKELREVTSCQAANELLSSGWILVNSAVNLQATPPISYFLLGWCATEKPSVASHIDRYSGNLSHDARM